MRTCHGKSCGGFFTTISSKYRLGFFTHPSVSHQYILSLLGSIVPNCEQCWEYTQPQSTLRDHLALPACQNTSQEVKLLSQKKFTHCGSDSCQEGSHENCLAQTLRLDNPFCRRSVQSDDIFGGPVNSITGSLIITDKRGSRSAKTDHLRFSTERATRVLHLVGSCFWMPMRETFQDKQLIFSPFERIDKAPLVVKITVGLRVLGIEAALSQAMPFRLVLTHHSSTGLTTYCPDPPFQKQLSKYDPVFKPPFTFLSYFKCQAIIETASLSLLTK